MKSFYFFLSLLIFSGYIHAQTCSVYTDDNGFYDCEDDGCTDAEGNCQIYSGSISTTHCKCEGLPSENRRSSNQLGNSFTTGITKLSTGDVIAIDRFNENNEPMWTKLYGHEGYNSGHGIATDILGNNITTGEMQNTVAFDTETFTSFGDSDIFIVKNDENGNELWAAQAGSSGEDRGFDITIDDLGNSYVVGNYSGTAYFDDLTLAYEGEFNNGFVAKYNANGNVVWVKALSGLLNDALKTVSIDSEGNVLVAGTFSQTATFGGTTVTADIGAKSLFVAKMTSDGTLIWAKHYDNAHANALTTDDLNNVFIAGIENDQMLLLKYTSNGVLAGEKHVQSDGEYFRLQDITIKEDGNIQVIGMFKGDISIDGHLLMNEGAQDIFLGEFNSNLATVWAKREGGTAADWGIGIHNDRSGFTSYVGCTFGTSTVGGITQTGDNLPYYRRFDDEADSGVTTGIGTTLSEQTAITKVYPNPFTDYFNIEMVSLNAQKLHAQLIDLTGRIIQQESYTIEQGEHTLSLKLPANLASGLYMLQLMDEKGNQYIEKVIR